jgi:hypothetical protein
MIISLGIESSFEAILLQERLADRSQFSAPQLFEELPLFSRFDQVAFLSHFGDTNVLLLELAIKYLKDVVDIHPATSPWLAAVTVWEHDSDEPDPIVPKIFVCNGDVRSRMRDIDLQPATGKLASFIESTLRSNGHSDEMQVMEDASTIAGSVRCFIGYKTPPKGMVGLDELR